MFVRIATRSATIKAPIARSMAVRGFSVSALQQKDVVQDLYLKGLKSYQPSPAAKADESQVKDLKLPPLPLLLKLMKI
ncbi:unnamed protein product [Cunninghamella echinulata]